MADSKNFINPYNFIPMGKEKGIADKDGQKRMYTGVIEYSVLTKSPLFIPNTSNDKTFEESYTSRSKETDEETDKEHKSYDFYSYHDLDDARNDRSAALTREKQFFRPVIPGSEIRGMFRSNFEILTNSCMSALDTDTRLSKRTMERFSAGLLKKKGNIFELHKASDALWRTKGENSTEDEEDWKGTDPSFYKRKCYIQQGLWEGCHVSFTEDIRGNKLKPLAKNVRIFENKGGGKEGYLIKGLDGPDMGTKRNKVVSQKHCCHIFYNPGAVVDTIPVGGNKLDLVLREYEREKKNVYQEYSAQWELFKKGKGEEYFPVYYSQIKDGGKKILFLSPACITREIYEHTLTDLAGDLKPCEGMDKLCPACSLFGTVMKESAVASRIRFSDLEGEKREDYCQCYEPITTLPPLSSPKLNNMEFYVKRPKDAWFWTYDYYVDADGNIHLQKGELAGRKFYWHNAKSLKSLEQEWEQEYDRTPNQRNVTVRPVKDGYQFKGQLYFKKLTQKELDLLIYLINAGDADELSKKKHGYKLGAAKPLGFGSIVCHVDRVKLLSYQRKECTVERQETEYVPQIKSGLLNQKTVQDFEKMTNLAPAFKEGSICYPRTSDDGEQDLRNMESEKENGDEGFAWFVSNHGGYNRKKQLKQDMASSRTNMIYNAYMEPMEPVLKKTGAGESSSSPQNQNRGMNPKRQNMKYKKVH